MIRKEILAKGVALLAVLFLVSVPTALAQDFCEADMNYDGYVQFNDLKIIKAEYNRDDCPPDGPAPVPKTGQTLCYEADGDLIDPCPMPGEAFFGQDGNYQKGVAWPNPRFTANVDNNGNGTCDDGGETCDGTVTDNLTGLIWLKNANCNYDTYTQPMIWTDALLFCNGLENGDCGLSDGSSVGDWRLPNRFELESLLDLAYYDPALPNTAGTGKWVEGDPFTNVQSYNYWSSTTYANLTNYAWFMIVDNGIVFHDIKSDSNYVWPVRGGRTPPPTTTTTVPQFEECDEPSDCGPSLCCCDAGCSTACVTEGLCSQQGGSCL